MTHDDTLDGHDQSRAVALVEAVEAQGHP